MKSKILWFALFTICLFCCPAQENGYGLLDKAKENLKNGDCELAKTDYDIYKRVTGKIDTSFEKQLQACQPPVSANHTPNTNKGMVTREDITVAKLKTQLRATNDSLEVKKSEVRRLGKQIETLMAEIRNLKNQLTTNNSAINSKNNEIEALRKELKNKESEVRNLNSCLREKEDTINTKDRVINTLENQINKQSKVINALENTIQGTNH